jgi:hypothetical protein
MMRLWTLHPKYLDPQGLVALWREALLAQAVLRGRTRGYRHHPQLQRFQAQAAPRSAINAYLGGVLSEADARGYAFDRRKLSPVRGRIVIRATDGQLAHEWAHLMRKLKARNPRLYRQWKTEARPEPHPLFRVVRGDIEEWERNRAT